MKRMIQLSSLFVALVVITLGYPGGQLVAQTMIKDQDFAAWLAAQWQEDLDADPERATSLGYKGYAHLWTDYSEAAVAARRQRQAQRLAQLNDWDPAQLTGQMQVSFAILKQHLSVVVAGHQFPDELLRINQMYGFHLAMTAHLEELPRTSIAEVRDIITKLAAIPTYLRQQTAWLKKGLARGVMPAKVTLANLPEQLKTLAQPPKHNPLLEPFNQLPASIPKSEQELLRAKAYHVFQTKVAPAITTMSRFLLKTYLPKARTTIGLADLPDGAAWYQNEVRRNTTLNLTPEEIHARGMEEVARIKAAMVAAMKASGFKGDFKSFQTFLKTDPQFYYTNAADLVAGYRNLAKTIDPNLVQLFRHLPSLPYGVKEIPAYRSQSATTAYYQPGSLAAGQPGTFYVNTFDLASRPKWTMAALTLHEAVPGHHLQIALAQELTDLPAFRRHLWHTAFIEGWALYAESLGDGMGLYSDPYSRIGKLNYEMWRAIRLVVDTGIHAFGWSRARALAYFEEHSILTNKNIQVEVDRYIGWPAQALGYKLGELTIQRLKEAAMAKKGPDFDIRVFHDLILRDGSVPLEYLENKIKRYYGES